MDYSAYQHILVEKKDGIALLTINRPETLNSTNARLHWELSKIWLNIADDDEVRVAVITGAGRAFSAGGDFEVLNKLQSGFNAVTEVMKEARDIVHNMINCDKPIISAINGVAVGAGLAVALLADISIASENAKFTDGHTRLGVAAGDHAAVIWPLLVGMAKAKYYLLTCDMLDAKEAERIGLVSLCVPPDQLMPKAMEVAKKLSTGAQSAIRWTKQSLNQWLRAAAHSSFDYSLALEMLGFFGDDVKEGARAVQERRPPLFPSAQDKK